MYWRGPYKLMFQTSIIISEAKYSNLNKCYKHCIFFINIIKELDYNINCLNVNFNNKTSINNSKNQSINPKIKHIDIRFHNFFFRLEIEYTSIILLKIIKYFYVLHYFKNKKLHYII